MVSEWDLRGFVPSGNPPDTNGRVGAKQYVQWNNTSFAVFNKTTGARSRARCRKYSFPRAGRRLRYHTMTATLWSSYDILCPDAGFLRSLLLGEAPTFRISAWPSLATEDATGPYFLYDFVTDPANFVDYPKIGRVAGRLLYELVMSSRPGHRVSRRKNLCFRTRQNAARPSGPATSG